MDGYTATEEINWKSILPQLYAFALEMVKNKPWFRHQGDETTIAGQQAKDYVHSAIEKYMLQPGSFDPTRGTLVNYLKFSLIRGAISNDAKKHENTHTNDVFGEARRRSGGEQGDETEISYLDRMLPHVEASFDTKYDYDQIMKHIGRECEEDKVVSDILCGLYEHNLKRREIINKYKMSAKDFDNGKRRLQTIIDNTRKKFKIDTHSHEQKTKI